MSIFFLSISLKVLTWALDLAQDFQDYYSWLPWLDTFPDQLIVANLFYFTFEMMIVQSTLEAEDLKQRQKMV